MSSSIKRLVTQTPRVKRASMPLDWIWQSGDTPSDDFSQDYFKGYSATDLKSVQVKRLCITHLYIGSNNWRQLIKFCGVHYDPPAVRHLCDAVLAAEFDVGGKRQKALVSFDQVKSIKGGEKAIQDANKLLEQCDGERILSTLGGMVTGVLAGVAINWIRRF